MTDARPAPIDPVSALAAAADAVARGDDLDETLGAILTAAAGAVGAVGGAIALQDPDRAGLEVVATIGGDPASGHADASDALAGAARSGAPAWGRADRTAGTVHADLPLTVRRGGIETVVGAATFAWPAGHEAGPAEQALLGAVADLAAVAIDWSRLGSLVAERSEWFERMAQSDPLTGLANQRTLARVLELELARAGRQGGEVSLALFDVDGFVATNAAGGHEAGDNVLRAVAAVLNESVRLVDTVARVGGDEFVLVAPGSAGMTVARRVLSGVAALPPVDGRPISVSAGVVRFPTDGATADELLAAALRALEAAKGRGPATLHESSIQPAG